MPICGTQAAVNRCIYCGSVHELTDEHVVPFGLNGTMILPKASCPDCNKRTSRAELYCLRDVFQVARIKLHMKTRRPRKRPRALPVFQGEARDDGTRLQTTIPVEDHPTFLQIPCFSKIPIVEGNAGTNWTVLEHPFFWTFNAFHEDEDDVEGKIERLRGLAPISTFDPSLLSHFLAKVAHATAVAFLGYDGFQHFVGRAISRGSDDVCDFVGGITFPCEIGRDSSFSVHVSFEEDLVVVTLCPFAHLGAPGFQVLVGRLWSLPIFV